LVIVTEDGIGPMAEEYHVGTFEDLKLAAFAPEEPGEQLLAKRSWQLFMLLHSHALPLPRGMGEAWLEQVKPRLAISDLLRAMLRENREALIAMDPADGATARVLDGLIGLKNEEWRQTCTDLRRRLSWIKVGAWVTLH
jgi:hypothetical protein